MITAGSGRPVNAAIIGDANQNGNTNNDRLPAARRNSFAGPDYATTDMRIGRTIYRPNKFKFDFTAESFNLFNRFNKRFQLTDDGARSATPPSSTAALSTLESTTSLLTARCQPTL